MKTITKDKAKELINQTNGRIFSATYIKKDLSKRIMNARLGKHYKSKTGKKAPYNPEKYNLKKVYDMKVKDFRIINLNTLISLSINKNKYIIK
tara:strand:+ start:838 stop:1116 length:279 start_codon:yes stop_codon:yes gene_type:complete